LRRHASASRQWPSDAINHPSLLRQHTAASRQWQYLLLFGWGRPDMRMYSNKHHPEVGRYQLHCTLLCYLHCLHCTLLCYIHWLHCKLLCYIYCLHCTLLCYIYCLHCTLLCYIHCLHCTLLCYIYWLHCTSLCYTYIVCIARRFAIPILSALHVALLYLYRLHCTSLCYTLMSALHVALLYACQCSTIFYLLPIHDRNAHLQLGLAFGAALNTAV
jgi:hypothetical protein